MQQITLSDLGLVEMWQDDGEMAASVNFPFTPSFPASTGAETDDLTVVYTELDADGAVGTHTESTEELFLLLEGTASVTVDGETSTATAGDAVVIPADRPHDVENAGDGPVRFVGVFPSADVTSEFDEPVQPLGERRFRTTDD